MRKQPRFHGIVRGKLRQSWNKHNLYNMARAVGKPTLPRSATFFQMKWNSKSNTRAYHGEHIAEKKWVRMFSRRLRSAVELPPKYLASFDGSEQAAGRGSGRSDSSVSAETYSKVPTSSQRQRVMHPAARQFPDNPVNTLTKNNASMTPYMQMTFAPLERRLDTAIFRALFASSVRQARQFVVHGAVKVNGVKMVHPAYLLNPGDMFQVEVEKVLYATGEQKKTQAASRIEKVLEHQTKSFENLQRRFLARNEKKTAKGDETAQKAEDVETDDKVTAEDGADTASNEVQTKLASLSPHAAWLLRNQQLKSMLKDVKAMLKDDDKSWTAKKKQQLRSFRHNVKKFLSQPENSKMSTQEILDELNVQIKNQEALRDDLGKFYFHEKPPKAKNEGASETLDKEPGAAGETTTAVDVMVGSAPKQNARAVGKAFAELSEGQKEVALRIMGETSLSRDEMRKLARIMKADEQNPIDETKPYATPWKPRPYMAPFAFIPRYLEVNPYICAAVYLRHPVARKGLAEVPTPFNNLTNQLAHNWYLGRG